MTFSDVMERQLNPLVSVAGLQAEILTGGRKHKCHTVEHEYWFVVFVVIIVLIVNKFEVLS